MSFEQHSEQALQALSRAGGEVRTTEEETLAITSAQVQRARWPDTRVG